MSEDTIATLFKLIREQTAELSAVKVTLARVEERMNRMCPLPGCLCAALKKEIEEMRLREATAEGVKKGITISVGVLRALVASGVLTIAFEAWQFFSK
jgi:hypothetical protein